MKLKAEYKGMNFEIEEDYPEVGAYLYLYVNGRCIRDELQDSVEICKEVAFNNYGVPLDIWKAEP